MARIFVSGLLNLESSAKVREFPIHYYPIDYPFFGVNTSVSGVALNIARALDTLGDQVKLASMTGKDLPGRMILEELGGTGIDSAWIRPDLRETPESVVLYDETGKRQIYCDLKDIQETDYQFTEEMIADVDFVAACNINFNRPLLRLAEALKKPIATDVHVLSDPDDSYNRDFMAAAGILFLSDEGIHGSCRDFLTALESRYHSRIIVLGMGKKGAMMYLRDESAFFEYPAYQAEKVVNTAGAGDALFSAFLHYTAKGYHPTQALDRAQLFAALKIRSSGAANGFVNEDELEAAFRRNDPISRGR